MCADDKGQASLRLRIDDVSKNHQKQSFVIQIAPDTNAHPLNNDISPDECSALEVRSKRNKTKRPREEDSISSSSSSGGGNSAAQKIANRNSHTAIAPAAAVLASLSTASVTSTKPSFSKPSSSSSSSASLPQTSSASDIQTVSRSVMEKTARENKRLNDLMSTFDSTTEEPKGGAPSREQVGETISGLVEWSQAMMEAVAALQWQFIGNEKLANGAVRPLYEMQNPNNTITELFSRYHDFAVPGLTLLYHNHFSHGGENPLSMPAPVKKEPTSSDVGM
jgi:hypothetical protein